MGKHLTELDERLTSFIQCQKIFFVATAPADGRVNLSPKGLDSFRVIDPSTVAWLNLTGSGNETAAHVLENRRMTVMFCAFDGSPLILRLYGRARAVYTRDADWTMLYARFEPTAGARQIFVLSIELVQTSCGMAVPYFACEGDRDLLQKWAEKKGPDGLANYWRDRNQVSLDGKPTGLIDERSGRSDLTEPSSVL